MTREIEYRRICEKLAGTLCPDNKLRHIKEHFLKQIDSARRFDRTNNIANLLRILEKRDSLNYEHIDPLRYIAVVLERNDIITLIDAYNHDTKMAYNEEPRLALNELPVRDRRDEEEIRVIPPIDPNPIERVYSIICTEIGHKWKDLARNLNVPEGKIDELESTHGRISDMVREVLRFHKENSDERYWRITLCRGLSDARRKDLNNTVSEIFAMHNLM